MKLYFSPLACSMATRVACYEAGVPMTFVKVDAEKRTEDGRDFRSIHALGLVPALELDDGEIVTENAAVLQYVGALRPDLRLVPQDDAGKRRLHQCLSFIGSELQKAIYIPLLDEKASREVKQYAESKAVSRLSWLAERLEGRDFLLEGFTVADAYLVTVLNWSQAAGVDLARWPAIEAYFTKLLRRPSVARALNEEKPLYFTERAKRSDAQHRAPELRT